MLQFARSHVRWLAIPVTLLLLLGGLTMYLVHPKTAHAAPTSASVPVKLLLVHGYNDTCDYAFNEIDQVPNTGPNPMTTVNFLTQHGWAASNIDDVGYYDPSVIYVNQRYDLSKNQTSDSLRGSPMGMCDHNLYNFSTDNVTSSLVSNCPYFPKTASALDGSDNEHIQTLGCELAWYIYQNYTRLGLPVSILAHSMGGLIVRDALGESGHSSGFPPLLDVRNVVTVATPHGGLSGGYLINARKYFPSTEVEDMAVGNAFMNMLGTTKSTQFQSPQGKFATHWSLIGADVPCGGLIAYLIDPTEVIECTEEKNSGQWPSGDGVVQGESMMAMNADYKVFYGQGEDFENSKPSRFYYADLETQYSHESNSCNKQTFVITVPGCLVYPFYLNDGTPSSQTVNVWICTSACTTNIADMTSNGIASAYHSLAEIVYLLGSSSLSFTTNALVLRSTANNDYVSAELAYTKSNYAELRARSTTQGSWESWTQVNLPNGNIALLSNANNEYVSTEVGYTGNNYGELRARNTTIGPWEVYQIVWLTGSTYALKSLANNEYVSAEIGYPGSDAGMLRARSTTIGSWETFTNSTGTTGCTNYGMLTVGPNICGNSFVVAGSNYPGTDYGWYSGGGIGFQGQEIWTYGNGTVKDSTATYSFTGVGSFYAYQIGVYIPNGHSNATHVHYHIHSSFGDTDQYINQQNFTNQWDTNDLGVVCTRDGNVTITLADDGGDNSPLQIGADAIQLVQTTHRCP